MSWLRKLLDRRSAESKDLVEVQDTIRKLKDEQARVREAGTVAGDHYTGHVERVKQLKREARHEEAIGLLLELVAATERESKTAGGGWGVAPWYYEQLAIIYRKEKRYDDEIAILERYQEQVKAPGVGPGKLAERLEKARNFRDRAAR